MRRQHARFLGSLSFQDRLGYFIIFITGISLLVILFLTKKEKEKELIQHYEQQISLLKEEHQKELQKTVETYNLSLREAQEKLLEAERRVSHLSSEVKTLKSRQKVVKFKIVHPDGKVEEKEFSQVQTEASSKLVKRVQEQFKMKVAEIEKRWMDLYRERLEEMSRQFLSREASYKARISQLESRERISIGSEKSSSLELGLLADRTYYLHGTLGIGSTPFFLGLHAERNSSTSYSGVGLGLGIRF